LQLICYAMPFKFSAEQASILFLQVMQVLVALMHLSFGNFDIYRNHEMAC